MGTQSRRQVYPFQYKTVSTINNIFCAPYQTTGTLLTFQISVPTNILRLYGLWTHFIIQFNSNEPVGNMKVNNLSIGNVVTSYANYGTSAVTSVYTFPPSSSVQPASTVNTSQQMSCLVDLTSILQNVYIFPQTSYSAPYFNISVLLPNTNYSATMVSWKADLIYTTQGIR